MKSAICVVIAILYYCPVAISQNEHNDSLYLHNFQTSSKINDRLKNDIRAESTPIASLSSKDFTDLYFLDSLLEKTDYLFLGESSHFIEEYSSLKVRMIKYLHEVKGYNVIGFESPYSNLNFVSKNRNRLDADTMLKMSLYKVWQTEELLELMRYLKSHQELNVFGFDCREGNIESSVSMTYLDEFNALNTDLGSRYAEMIEVFKRYVAMIPTEKSPNFSEKSDYLISEITELLGALNASDNSNFELTFHLNNLLSNTQYWMKSATESFPTAMRYRDSLMANNIMSITKNTYPDQKCVFWGHNAHISKNSLSSNYPKPMGEFLSEKMNSFHIGFYAFSGFYGKENAPIKRPKKKHLELLLNENRFNYSYIGIQADKTSTWSHKKYLTLNSGNGKMHVTPNKSYDGLIFISRVSKPNYIEGLKD